MTGSFWRVPHHPIRKGTRMATVIVRSDHDHQILMNEHVLPEYLDSDHRAVKLLEQLAWAIEDAHGQARRTREIVRRQAAAAA